MPNWKKVIVSGSNAALNSLTVATNVVAQSFTGSLFGTSSFANNATSASYALSASYAFNATSASYAATASSAQNASDILVYVKNSSGAQINKGKVVRIVGAVGDNPLIATASYEDDNNSANTLGITNENIANDSFGYVMTEGTLFGVDTSAFSAGQLIYLGATGSITGSSPVAPLHNVRLGEVLRVQLNNGSIYVRVDNGYELGELHDVRDTTTTGSYGDLLVKSGSIWINSRQLTGSYGLTGSLQATSFTGSLKGTSSFAVEAITATTSSHAISALSASYALTASYAATASTANSGFTIGTTQTYTNIVASSVVGSNNVFTHTTGSYTSAFYKYTVSNSANARSGEVIAVWNGSSAQYTDYSTLDIGSTSGVTPSVSVVSSDVLFNITTGTSGWRLKATVTYL